MNACEQELNRDSVVLQQGFNRSLSIFYHDPIHIPVSSQQVSFWGPGRLQSTFKATFST